METLTNQIYRLGLRQIGYYRGAAGQYCTMYRNKKGEFFYKDVAMPILPLDKELAKYYAWQEINRSIPSDPTPFDVAVWLA